LRIQEKTLQHDIAHGQGSTSVIAAVTAMKVDMDLDSYVSLQPQ
jgi:hypothetical protein